MNGFIGNALVSVDQKGRTSLPLEFRKQWSSDLGNQVVVTIFADQSLLLRSMTEWNTYLFSELNIVSKKSSQGSHFSLRVTSMAKQSVLDGQNRILLSSELMKYANIEKEVVFTGDGTSIRLWSPKRYEEMMSLTEEQHLKFENLFYKEYEAVKS